jgi:hypothetical protein
MPSAVASARAVLIASGEKSMPVTLAPSRAQERVSMPKWHWRWRSALPLTSPTSSLSMGKRLERPALKEATS